MEKRNFISASGVLCSVAKNTEELCDALELSLSGVNASENFFSADFPVKAVGLIENLNSNRPFKEVFLEKFSEITRQIKISSDGIDEIDSVFICFGISDLRPIYEAEGFSLTQEILRKSVVSILDDQKIHLTDHSKIYLIDNTCASSLVSLGMAASRIDKGLFENSLVVAIDLISTQILLNLNELGALAKGDLPVDRISRPFSKTRNGFVRSEAAVGILIESDSSLKKRNYKKSCNLQIAGYARTSDAYHIAAGRPDFQGITKVMKSCLSNANIGKEQVSFIKAHGTGTVLNDKLEAMSIQSLFSNETPVVSFKGQFGHTASASGAFETLLCAISMQNKKIYRSWNSEDLDNFNIDVVQENRSITSIEYVLLNAFGFGGLNCSLILKNLLNRRSKNGN